MLLIAVATHVTNVTQLTQLTQRLLLSLRFAFIARVTYFPAFIAADVACVALGENSA